MNVFTSILTTIFLLHLIFVCLLSCLTTCCCFSAFHESSTIEVSSPKHLIIAVTSDRGLCGGIHSNMGKHIRSLVAELPADETVKIVTCGDKLRALFQRNNASQMALAFSELGKQPMQFGDAAFVAQKILEAGVEYDKATVVFNKFK